MTPEEFQTWLTESGFTWEQAAEALDVNRSTIKNYRDRGGGKALRLLCLAAKKTPSLSRKPKEKV